MDYDKQVWYLVSLRANRPAPAPRARSGLRALLEAVGRWSPCSRSSRGSGFRWAARGACLHRFRPPVGCRQRRFALLAARPGRAAIGRPVSAAPGCPGLAPACQPPDGRQRPAGFLTPAWYASQRSRPRTGHGSAGAASRWRAPAGRWAARPLVPAPRGGDTRARTAEAPVPPPSAPQGAREGRHRRSVRAGTGNPARPGGMKV